MAVDGSRMAWHIPKIVLSVPVLAEARQWDMLLLKRMRGLTYR